MNLEKYKNDSGFKVPDNYMEDFEVNLFEKLEISSLERKENKSGFQVPTDYFDTFEDTIQAKLNINSKRGRLINLFSNKQLYYASAIAAILLIVFSTGLLKSTQTSDLNNLDYAAIEQYIDEEDMDLNYNDISNLIYEEGLIMDDFNSYSLSEQAVFEYLNENVEDSGLIIE
ncbi:hypothetical protein BC962_1568 [Gillisia mitskevichiae]|uniref:Uncharacterized protein n=1 Tax=Gillisia mitskevichiae TaxID=270921 RepID=A0A495PV27_9FLAO|nr:hypothetical protein [Gillisia mitskevichiae]RKS53318.1 hypothetical protein BC962_1568 [Gillisia mitskevichiae]